MNKRIKELGQEAGLLMYNPNGLPTKLEKFAELIVKECANYAYSDDQDHKAMLKHFGVEE